MTATTLTPAVSLRPPYFSVAVISAMALAYEILLMRLFSIIQWHHFAYMFIGLALLGYGISGTVVAIFQQRLAGRFVAVYIGCIILFAIMMLVSFALAQQIPFNAEAILWDGWQLLYLAGIFLMLTIPFFLVASAICLAFMQFGKQVSRMYAADLLGAGIGSIGVIVLLVWLFPQSALLLLAVSGMLAALLACQELQANKRWKIITVLILVVMLVLMKFFSFNLQLSAYKELLQIQRINGVNIIAEQSSPLGLISVVESAEVPLRHAPGLSLHATDEPLEQLGVFTDGDNMTVLTQYPREQRKLAYLDQTSSALPYHLKPLKHVLLAGVGGGADILLARYHQVPKIDGIEINQQMIQLLQHDYASYTGNLYQQPGVSIYHAEVRDFLATSSRRYDMIQLALLDAFNASSSGLYALNENYLYTVEALKLYLKHLQDDGYLALTRWIKLPPRDTLKMFATAVTALKQLGVSEPEQHLILIRNWQTSTLLVKNGRFSSEELDAVKTFSNARGFDLAYAPGLKDDLVNRFNILEHPIFFQAATALLGKQQAEFIEQYKFNLQPATDDKPYFNQFYKWSSFNELFQKRNRGGMPLLEWGFITLLATLGLAILFSLLLVFVPLWYYNRQQLLANTVVRQGDVLYYFFAIGLAFLFIEIAFIQKFILLLHHPIYSIAVSLTAFLIFAGLGSFWSGILLRTKSLCWILRYAVGSIIVVSVIYLLLFDTLFTQMLHLPVVVRMMLTVILIAPLAVCMGMPFPLAISALNRHAKHYIPWAWGINGCASVISAVLATVLSVNYGFVAVILLACLLYASVLFVVPGRAKLGT